MTIASQRVGLLLIYPQKLAKQGEVAFQVLAGAYHFGVYLSI